MLKQWMVGKRRCRCQRSRALHVNIKNFGTIFLEKKFGSYQSIVRMYELYLYLVLQMREK